MIYREPKCERCKHILHDRPGYHCRAFPDKIPEPILTGEFEHTVRFPRQKNNIIFEPQDGNKLVTIDGEFQIPVFSVICNDCSNLTDGSKRKCKAFPDEIPYEIWVGKNPHIELHPEQDNDILFEHKDPKQLRFIHFHKHF